MTRWEAPKDDIDQAQAFLLILLSTDHNHTARRSKPFLGVFVVHGPSWDNNQHDKQGKTESCPESDIDIPHSEACHQSDHLLDA
jgi:hypothetical protein